jgi:putative ABC transport system ATP-binding protein
VAEPVVVAEGLRKTFRGPQGEIVALDGVSFAARAGQLTAITGASGSGKSTLLQLLAGLDRADAGTITISGHDITRLGDRALSRLRRRQMGFVFQSFNLIGSMTARENIALPVGLDGRTVDESRLAHLVELLGIADRLDHYPGQLSGGQQQRVAVARALLPDPDVVFADEPTGALDPESAAALARLLVSLAHDLGQCVVIVTHDPSVAALADRDFRMSAGRLLSRVPTPQEGASEEVRAS